MVKISLDSDGEIPYINLVENDNLIGVSNDSSSITCHNKNIHNSLKQLQNNLREVSVFSCMEKAFAKSFIPAVCGLINQHKKVCCSDLMNNGIKIPKEISFCVKVVRKI